MADTAPETAAGLCKEGVRLRQTAHYRDAERCLLRALELEHDFGAAHLELGFVYRDQQKIEDAVDHLQLAVHFAPACVAGWLGLASSLDQLGRADPALAAARQAATVDPDNDSAWLAVGGLFKARGDWNAAIDAYRRAAACNCTSADALCLLGYALYKTGHYGEAIAQLESALALDPAMYQAHHNLGLALLETGRAKEALACFERALAVNPLIETRACKGHALRDLGQLDDAVRLYDEVLGVQPEFADVLTNRAYALLMKGDYAAGWTAYEQRIKAGQVDRDFGCAPWQGEPLAGKRILIYAEQGLGDEIMFASCLPEVIALAAHCVVECNTRLAPLFRRSFPGVEVIGANKHDKPDWLARLPAVDYQSAIGSLPRFFRRTAAAFSTSPGYLQPDARRVSHWQSLLTAPQSIRIGIAWRGGSLQSRQFLRSIPLSLWAPLLCSPRATFFALQYGDVTGELAALEVQSSARLASLGGAVNDLDELAAVISALDLVISVDNTVAHLAGALGKPVWTMLPESPEWRYPRSGEAMPWYPTMRLLHRAPGESGEAMIQRVNGRLSNEPRPVRDDA
jgi:tetratricopeptide (TPR) repeat protein